AFSNGCNVLPITTIHNLSLSLLGNQKTKHFPSIHFTLKLISFRRRLLLCFSSVETQTTSSAIRYRVDQQPEDQMTTMMMMIRSCIDCHTTTTPCWRGGPAGPRTLCNACGIRYRKSRKSACSSTSSSGSAEMKMKKKKKKKRKIGKGEEEGGDEELVAAPKVKKLLGLMGLDKWKRKKQQFGEEEIAAILLMSLSGSIRD
ncbi:GATA transcription factor 16, partial [Linum perenne]